jgi:hypothetical protein
MMEMQETQMKMEFFNLERKEVVLYSNSRSKCLRRFKAKWRKVNQYFLNDNIESKYIE